MHNLCTRPNYILSYFFLPGPHHSHSCGWWDRTDALEYLAYRPLWARPELYGKMRHQRLLDIQRRHRLPLVQGMYMMLPFAPFISLMVPCGFLRSSKMYMLTAFGHPTPSRRVILHTQSRSRARSPQEIMLGFIFCLSSVVKSVRPPPSYFAMKILPCTGPRTLVEHSSIQVLHSNFAIDKIWTCSF